MSGILWKRFQDRYPHADLPRFKQVKDLITKKPNVVYQSKDGIEEIDVFDGDKFRPSIYFSEEMKKALGLPVGFPLELTLNYKPSLPIPAVPFDSRPHSIGSETTSQEIFVTPSDSFHIKFRDIFSHTKLTHYSAKESHRWLNSPDMKYWPQQLNFAVWCATTGCGISDRLLFQDKDKDGKDVTDTELYLPKQVRAFLWFHVYFTIRRILHALGGIQGGVALPGDKTFDQKNNRYDIPSYHRLCNEFGINNNSDFRFHGGINHGLGNVYIYAGRYYKTNAQYPGGRDKFSDEGGKASDGNLIQYIENKHSEKQYEYFTVPVSHGLTRAGQARINQSIEAFVYCILGSQVNVRSTIVGDSGSAQEVRREFLVLFEGAIRQPDISKSVQRFQLSVQEAKVKLDLAISPDTWLMPSRMVINTESTIGYNNKLKRANPSMKLGVNSEVNAIVQPVGVRHNLGKSKVNLPHALVDKSQALMEASQHKVGEDVVHTPTSHDRTSDGMTKHEVNLVVIGVLAAGFTWYIFR